MLSDIETLRFSYEIHLLKAIGARIGYVPLRDFTESKQLLDARRWDLMGDAVCITKDLLPEIHGVYQSCLDLIGGGLTGDLFVQQSSVYNAGVFAHDRKFDILVHSALLNDFSHDELRFVFGHELGHVLFQHTHLPVHDILMNSKDLDQESACLLLRWSRASEVSADRLGMLCCGQLGAAATALFRTASGLASIDENRVLRAFRCQYDELSSCMKTAEDAPFWIRTHPMLPIRFKALELAALDIIALGRGTGGFSVKGFQAVDQQISLLMETLDFRPAPR